MNTRPKTGSRGEYSRTLQDPRWQKKRLEIMERAKWRCEWCQDSKSNLQVHHGYYGKTDGRLREPWEVPADVLYCLCERCHERAEAARQALYLELGRIHPRHHWHVRQILQEVQRLIEQGEELGDARVEKAEAGEEREPADRAMGVICLTDQDS